MSKRQVARPPPESESEEEEEEDDEEEEEVDPIEFINALPLEQRRRVYGLKALVKATRAAQRKKRDRIAAIERDYLERMQPLFELRRKIVLGEHEPTAEEVARGEKVDESKIQEIPSDEDEDAKKPAADAKKGVKVIAPSDVEEADELKVAASKADGGIPSFWLTAMKNNEVLEGMIMKRDEEALKALKNITSEFIDNDARKGFKITFTFGENAFFSEKTLTKTYVMDPEEEEDYQCDDIIGCPITWSSPANKLTVVIKEKKQRHKSGKGVRVVQKEEKCPSFFHFFDPPKMPRSDDDEAEKKEEDDEEDVDDILQMDYEAGQAFHEMLIPRAVYYYTGESIADLASGMADYGDDGDEEQEEEEEEEEEEQVPPPKRGGAARGGAGAARGGARGGRGGADAPECKQQ